MPEWDVEYGGNRISDVNNDLANTLGTIASGSSVNTKGSWIELTPSTPFSADGLMVTLLNPIVTIVGSFLCDIGIGDAGSEIALLRNLTYSGRAFNPHVYIVPIRVPAGTRLTARTQCTSQFAGMSYTVKLLTGSWLSVPSISSRAITYGDDPASSGGTQIDPGASVNTKGSYTQIVSSTAQPIHHIMIMIGSEGNAARSDATWLMDVSIGAAASEIPILPNIPLASGAVQDTVCPNILGPFTVNIPAGTRIAIRAQCSINDASDRLFDVSILALD